MRIESVTAHAFGPFSGRTLKLAPGMNVVYGPNESGKSTWHAALEVGLCGVRDRRGNKWKKFASRRKPWDGTKQWSAGVVIVLADGRRIDLHQDLAAGTGKAVDADIADCDYSAEVNQDGTPDAARWLGLTRASFTNTACVPQALIFGIRDGAKDLQEALQKAAANADKDATAAQALDRLEDYRKEHVGTPQAWTKPLYLSQNNVEKAHSQLCQARDDHVKYQDRRNEIARLEAEVGKLKQRIGAVCALAAEDAAQKAEHRLEGIRKLRLLHPDGPPKPVDNYALANEIAAAIGAWGAAPSAPLPPTGKTCQELEIEREVLREDRRLLDASPPRPRLAAVPCLAGVGLFAVAGLYLWLKEMPLVVGVVAAVAGVGVVAWAVVRSRRTAAEEHRTRADMLDERLRGIEDRIDRRREGDAVYDDAVKQRRKLQRRLQDAAADAGIADATPQALRDWQDKRQQRLIEVAAKAKSWNKLQIALAGQALEEVERETAEKRDQADALLCTCDEEQLLAARTERPLGELQQEEVKTQARLNKERGVLESTKPPSIADAEDNYEDAQRKLHRLQSLDEILEKAIKFLEDAQQHVHRDIAQVLRDTLLEWLPKVTGGRYTDCKVDPKTLVVEVLLAESGDWQRADLLSHGTAEQVYLLLRLALCRHLVAEGETCPLILDDPISACDADRRRLILETLLVMSESTQLILFTHDDDVRDWAHRRLPTVRNCKVIDLPSSQPEEPSLGTRIANRFRGEGVDAPFEALRGASIRPIDFA